MKELNCFWRAKARLHAGERDEGARHQPGTDQQHQSQRHLYYHQHVACTMLLAALACAARAFTQSYRQPRARVSEDGNAAEEHAGQHRHAQGKQQHPAINANLMHARQAAWRHRHQHTQRAISNAKSQQAA